MEKAQPGTKSEIEYLLAGNSIEKPIAEDMTYGEIYQKADSIWSFLFYTGYLTAAKIRVQQGVTFAFLCIPNQEIKYIFINKIQEWFQEVVIEAEGNKVCQYMIHKDSVSLQALLNELLYQTISYMDYQENYYHGLMTGLLAQTDFMLKSNRETGLGRADLTLQDSRTAVIIELKVAESSAKLGDVCKMALQQIDEKKYVAEFSNLDCIKVGIAFYQKSCTVMIE